MVDLYSGVKMEVKKLECLVADSAAFIRNVDLQNLSGRIFTIREVILEIRDAATRQRLAVLPYDIDFREPSTESINFVTEFSKKTGDYKSLSAVDMRVLALSYQLEKEFGNPDKIKSEPAKKAQVVQHSKVQENKHLAGFYRNRQQTTKENKDGVDEEVMETDNCVEEENEGNKNQDEKEELEINEPENDKIEKEADDEIENKDNIMEEDDSEDDSEVEEEEEEEAQDGDDDGWITPKNISKVKKEMGHDDEIDLNETDVNCACLTTDFAMQNVLIQMGLHVLSVQGRLIRQARNYIQKCFGCNKETHDMEKIFCPSCGNKTLKKISVTIGEDGAIQYHFPKRKRNPNLRGTKFSIALPKGGRHTDMPLLTEDQTFRQNRMPRNKDKTNPFDVDYVSRNNPFSQKDVNSRAFHLNLHVKNKQPRNPNETRKKKTSRKK